MINFIRRIFNSKVIKNSAWLITDKIIRLVGGVFIGAWIARYLGPEQYGLMNFATAFSIVFISFSMLGIDNLVIRDLAKKENDFNDILGTAVRIRIFGSILSAVLSLIFAWFFYSNNQAFIYLLTVLMIGNILQSLDVLSLWYQSQINSKVIVKNKVIAYIGISLFKVIAIFFKMDLICFVILTVLELVIGILLLLRWYVNIDGFCISKWKYYPETSKRLLKEGWPLAISNFSIIIFMKADQLFLGGLLGAKAVGIYSVASLISDILYSLPIFLTASIFPKMADMYMENREKYRDYINKIFLTMVGYSYISLLAVYFFVDIFIESLYGYNYIMSAEIAKIHVITLLFVSIGCVKGNMLLIENKATVLSLITIIGGGINLGLNYIFIPKYGLYGAAFAILISQSFVGYISGLFHKSLHEIFWGQTKAMFLWPLWKKIHSK